MTVAHLRRLFQPDRVDGLLVFVTFAQTACWIALIRTAGLNAPFNPLFGVASALLILWGSRRWPAIALGTFLALAAASTLGGLAGRIGDTAALVGAAALTAWIIEKRGIRPDETLDPGSLLWVFLSAIAGALVAGTVGASSRNYLGVGHGWTFDFIDVTIRSGIGLLIASPLVLAWAQSKTRFSPFQWSGFVAAMLLSVLTTVIVMMSLGRYPIGWLIFPPLIYVSLRYHLRGAVTGVALVAATILAWVQPGFRPALIADGDVTATLQMFLAGIASSMLLLASYADKRREQELLRIAETRYRAVFEQAGVGVSLLTLDGYVIEMNDRGVELAGRPREQVIGTHYETLLAPEDFDVTRRNVERLKRGEAPYQIGLRTLVAANGDCRSVHITTTLVRTPAGDPDHLVSVVQDLTERIAAESALEESDKLLRIAQEAAAAGVWVIDINSGAAHLSPQCTNLFEVAYREEAYTFRDLRHRVSADQAERVSAQIVQAHARREPLETTIKLTLPDNRKRWIRLYGTADEDSPTPRMIGLTLDVTNDIEAQEQIRDAQDRLLRVARLGAMGTMASTLAHELNQPLTAISNFIEVGRYGVETMPDGGGSIAHALEMAQAQTRRAAAIIRRMRAFAISGEVASNKIDLEQVVSAVMNSVAQIPGADEVAIEHLIPLGVEALGDPLQIEQVIGNLVRNAVEATEGQKERRVSVRADLHHGQVLVQVSDNGPGLPAEMLDSLFEPFRTTKDNGTGLGLPICRAIVEAHGGRLWARNNREGAEFRFTLRRYHSSPAELLQDGDDASAAPDNDLSPNRLDAAGGAP